MGKTNVLIHKKKNIKIKYLNNIFENESMLRI